jgi:hypothetical protein
MSLPTPTTQLACAEARELVREHLAGTLEGPAAEALVAHLEGCAECRGSLAAALAASLLREAHAPTPPADLVANINSAARTYLRYQRRPIHQKALGSPAFFATCASLLCGAVICLLAIMRVATAPTGEARVMMPGAFAAHQVALAAPTAHPPTPAPRAPSPVAALLARLPGGPHPPSLVAVYPRRPVMVNIGSARPARLELAPLSRHANTPDG